MSLSNDDRARLVKLVQSLKDLDALIGDVVPPDTVQEAQANGAALARALIVIEVQENALAHLRAEHADLLRRSEEIDAAAASLIAKVADLEVRVEQMQATRPRRAH